MFAALLAVAALAAPSPSRAAVEIAAQERAFARMCVEKGMRASFSEYFAPDAIDFDPGPAPAAPSIAKNPDASAPFTLDWEPWIADASLAGDLGWDTGPYVLTDRPESGKPARHGWFFSVWRRQPDGRWKVALDVGTKGPAAAVPLRPAMLAAFPLKGSRPPRLPGPAEKETAALVARDRASSGSKALWLSEARLHRDGEPPIAGIVDIEKRTEGRGAFGTSPTGGGVAKSGDLGYTYGSYVAAGEKGWYARVWKMTESGDWKLAVQIEKPLPKEK
jgi:ketosteroid isomerase-like protein